MTYEDKTCIICGKLFTPITFGQKCCSKECSRINHNNKNPHTVLTERTCPQCEEKFMPTNWRQIYCCEQCKYEYETKMRKERKKENKPVKHVNLEERYAKRLAEDPYAPQPRKCPGLPWYRCNKMLSPNYSKYRCPSCDKKWRTKYNLPLFDANEE